MVDTLWVGHALRARRIFVSFNTVRGNQTSDSPRKILTTLQIPGRGILPKVYYFEIGPSLDLRDSKRDGKQGLQGKAAGKEPR